MESSTKYTTLIKAVYDGLKSANKMGANLWVLPEKLRRGHFVSR